MASGEQGSLLPNNNCNDGLGVSSSTAHNSKYVSSKRYTTTPLILSLMGIGLLCFIIPLIDRQQQSTSISGLSFLGKSKQQHQTKAGKEKKYDCENDKSYSKHTLKSAYDLPYAALFKDTRGQKKFEASDVTIVNDAVYSVCDSSWAISKFTRDLVPFSDKNVQIGNPNRQEEDSGYEAIFEHEGLFYVVRESVYHNHHDNDQDDDDSVGKEKEDVGDYHAIIEELDLGEDDYTVVRECKSEFVFEGDSKGFEGAVGFPDKNGVLYILGLCEGNHCSETKKNDIGNGRLVLMKKNEVKGTDCLWETVRGVSIPKSASFLDYSAIDITDEGRVAITSQEDSAVWLGHTSGISNGIIDPGVFEFEDDDSSVMLQFPKDGGCHTVYCNIEGIHWMNDDMLMAVSDKMKSKGRQDFRCHEKDQSIHAFVIP